jgi:hypothetical protein
MRHDTIQQMGKHFGYLTFASVVIGVVYLAGAIFSLCFGTKAWATRGFMISIVLIGIPLVLWVVLFVIVRRKASRPCADTTEETCFNLWYYLDEQQNITAIAANAYLLKGSDEQKGLTLSERSEVDYCTIAKRAITPLHYSMLPRIGVEEVFFPEFERIRKESPNGMKFSTDKLYCSTPLYDFGEGFEPAEIGDGFIKQRNSK